MVPGDGESAGFTIRPASPEDAPFLADCWRAMLDELEMAPGGLLPEWRTRLTDFFAAGMVSRSQGWFLAVSPERRLVGAAGALIGETTLIHIRPVATIAGVYVQPDFRRHGVARDLTVNAVAWARERGCSLVRLTASRDGEPLYRSLGFRPREEMVLRLE
jgi:GNAT superfamily N-acetyltransferase